MKLKDFLFLLVILKSIPAYACQKDTVKLFYGINQKELSNTNKVKLDSLGKWITDTTTVQILGFADYLG